MQFIHKHENTCEVLIAVTDDLLRSAEERLAKAEEGVTTLVGRTDTLWAQMSAELVERARSADQNAGGGWTGLN